MFPRKTPLCEASNHISTWISYLIIFEPLSIDWKLVLSKRNQQFPAGWSDLISPPIHEFSDVNGVWYGSEISWNFQLVKLLILVFQKVLGTTLTISGRQEAFSKSSQGSDLIPSPCHTLVGFSRTTIWGGEIFPTFSKHLKIKRRCILMILNGTRGQNLEIWRGGLSSKNAG